MFKYISADCGSGKTHSLIQQIKSDLNNYIIVQSTLQLCSSTAEACGSLAREITTVNYNNVLTAAVEFLKNPSHRVLIMTDITFLQIRDNNLLEGWKIYLDDVVNFHKFITVSTEMKELVETKLLYDFEVFTENYVTAKPVTELNDDILRDASTKFKELQRYDHSIMNAAFFEKIGGTNQYKEQAGQLQIMSWVDYNRLKELDVTFMANDFESTLLFLSAPKDFKKVELNVRQRKVAVKERINVYYFSDTNLSKMYRDTHADNFNSVLFWINNNVSDYIYTMNSDVSINSLNGTYVKPKSRGLNNYQEYKNVVWMASMKPSNNEVSQLEAMFNITSKQIIQAREKEELYQFVQRSNLRDYESTEMVNIYVFDKEQALSLTDNPIKLDIGITLEREKKERETMDMPPKVRVRYSRVGTSKKIKSLEDFKVWINSDKNSDLTPAQKEHFIKRYIEVTK